MVAASETILVWLMDPAVPGLLRGLRSRTAAISAARWGSLWTMLTGS